MMQPQTLDDFFSGLTDWRGDRLHELFDLITQSAPELKQEMKWGVPVWSSNGLVCAISGFKDHIKMNFFKGASLPDQSMFNNGLDSKTHRSIDWAEGDKLDKPAIEKLIKAAIEFNKK